MYIVLALLAAIGSEAHTPTGPTATVPLHARPAPIGPAFTRPTSSARLDVLTVLSQRVVWQRPVPPPSPVPMPMAHYPRKTAMGPSNRKRSAIATTAAAAAAAATAVVAVDDWIAVSPSIQPVAMGSSKRGSKPRKLTQHRRRTVVPPPSPAPLSEFNERVDKAPVQTDVPSNVHRVHRVVVKPAQMGQAKRTVRVPPPSAAPTPPGAVLVFPADAQACAQAGAPSAAPVQFAVPESGRASRHVPLMRSSARTTLLNASVCPSSLSFMRTSFLLPSLSV